MKFKLVLLLVAAGVAGTVAAHGDAGRCADPDAKVLILGAGMAGIKAAQTLDAGGEKDFIILEARDSIGGRIRSVQFAGATVELGANWIQGVDPEQPLLHPLWDLAQQCGLEGFYSDYHYHSLTTYNATGEKSDLLRWDDLEAAFKKALDISLQRQEEGLPDISVREALTMAGWTPTTPEDNFIEWYRFDFCFAESPDNSSTFLSLPIGEVFGGSDRFADWFVTDSRGFDYLVECLAATFLDTDQDGAFIDERLHLNANVTDEITWSDECVCASAMEGSEVVTYCAPYGILTFSLGVLQSEELIRFQPELPEEKLNAINLLSMAHCLKIFVSFNESFWDNLEFIGYAAEDRGYYPVFQDLQILPERPNSLIFTLKEDLADSIVRQPVEETKEQIMTVLRTIYGDGIPDIEDILVPDWDINPLYFGSYSNSPVGATRVTRKTIAKPAGRLWFSGEATSVRYNGYVHGAFLSGESTAKKILKAMESGAASLQSGVIVMVTMVALLMLIE